jgi:hypothetical protein
VTVQKFTTSDIKSTGDYESTRRAFQAFVDHLWRDRCFSIGPRVRIVFENRQTLLFQLQESLRASGADDDRVIRKEIEVFNGLVPARGQLRAVLLIDIPEHGDRARVLEELAGVEQSVVLRLGSRHAVRPAVGAVARSCFGARALAGLVFSFSSAELHAFRDPGAPAFLEIVHERYSHRAEIGAESRRSLISDLGSRTRRKSAQEVTGRVTEAGTDEVVQAPPERP